MKRVTIIIPAYNCEKYIEKCLASVLEQTGAEIEVIVVNDGSADSTPEILKRYEGRIEIINRENGGAARARNTGLERAGGDYVMFLDSDDTLEKGAVERLVKKAEETKADIVRFRYKNVLPDGNEYVPEYQPDKERLILKKDFKKEVYPLFMEGITLNSVCFSMFRREITDGLSFRDDMKIAEDAVFSLDAFTRAQSVLFLPDVMYAYLQTGSGLTGTAATLTRKYADNYRFALATINHLKEWGMDSPKARIKALFRPIRLTIDKIKRMKLAEANKK